MSTRKPILKRAASGTYLALILAFLYAPILTLVVLSFNASKSRAAWGGFTLDWYAQVFESDKIMSALYNSLTIALISSAVATVIGVLACVGIQAMSRGHRTFWLTLNNIPMLNADIVTGLSLMIAFGAFGISLGYGSILMAHIAFCIPYVILSVMPRIKATSAGTYEAALDLGASPVQAFARVVLPELMPGIIAGFLLSFTMSLDDFVISYFVRGRGIDTLSTLIYSQVRRGIKPTMYALSTLIFAAILIILLVQNFVPGWLERRRSQSGRRRQEQADLRSGEGLRAASASMVAGQAQADVAHRADAAHNPARCAKTDGSDTIGEA